MKILPIPTLIVLICLVSPISSAGNNSTHQTIIAPENQRFSQFNFAGFGGRACSLEKLLRWCNRLTISHFDTNNGLVIIERDRKIRSGVQRLLDQFKEEEHDPVKLILKLNKASLEILGRHQEQICHFFTTTQHTVEPAQESLFRLVESYNSLRTFNRNHEKTKAQQDFNRYLHRQPLNAACRGILNAHERTTLKLTDHQKAQIIAPLGNKEVAPDVMVELTNDIQTQLLDRLTADGYPKEAVLQLIDEIGRGESFDMSSNASCCCIM